MFKSNFQNSLQMTFQKLKNVKFYFGLTLLSILIFYSCSGGGGGTVVETPKTPSNLNVTVELVGANTINPNGDGSGTIIVNFSATNATSYKVNFGNGDVTETAQNSVTYTYVGSGIKTFTIYVSAYNQDKFITANNSISIYIAPTMAFFDEFDVNGAPNSSKWTYDLTNNNGWGNNEAQYYTDRPDNVIVEGGLLKITAKKESYSGFNYTSARIKTQGKFSFKYGKVEVRAKLPSGGGTWPAIWMLGSSVTSIGWPACGEIDIMEEIGNDLGRIHGSIHTPSSYGGTTNTATTMLSDASTAFHVYGLEWDSQKINFSIDGVVFYTYNPSVKNSDTWPFDANQFIILNVAMGGNFGGAIDSNFSQSTMEIDYVRVYQ